LSLWRGWHTKGYQNQRESANKPLSGFVVPPHPENQPAFLLYGLVKSVTSYQLPSDKRENPVSRFATIQNSKLSIQNCN